MTSALIFMQQHTEWFIAIAILVAIGGLWITIHEIRFRVERRKVARANLLKMRVEETLEREYHVDDVLYVMNMETDTCDHRGYPVEAYHFLLDRRYGKYEVYNSGTGKRVSEAKFLAKYESEMAAYE